MVMFVAGMAVSHYGTSYLFVSAFVLAYPSLILLKIIKTEYRIGYRSSKIGNPDPKENIKTLRKHVDRISIEGINFLLLAFLIIFVVAWYLNTAGGIKFQLLVETIGSIGSLTQTSGLAEERVFSAQPFSIEVTRAMIVLFFVLIGIGFVTEVVRKLLIGSSEISDEHLTLAAGVVGVFALTFTGIGTGFGQGRVLMFSLSLSSLFAVRGLHNLRHISEFLSPRVDPLKRIREATAEHVTEDRVRTSFAGVLCVFLLLNTGVVAETITQDQDYGATIIVNNERLSQNDDARLRIESQGCIQCDVQVHLWTVRYGNGRSQVYHGGFFQSHYWYGHSVAAGLDDFVTDYLLTNRSTLYWEPLPAESTGIPDSSYLVLTHDNHDSGLIVTEEENVVSIDSVRPSLERSNRVYTSGHSTVYRSRNTTASVDT
jgi:uncharacterized membrane protein